MTKHVIDAQCGCGCVKVLKRLDEEADCPSCGWPIIYATDTGFALSRHFNFQLRAVPKRSTP